MRMFRRRTSGAEGATAVEYAIILAGTVIGLVAIVLGLKATMGDALDDAAKSQAVLSDGSTVAPSNGPTSVVLPPAAPSVSANPGNRQIAITWAPVSGATSYVVTCNGNQVTVTGTGYTCTNLTNGTPYTVTVVARGGSGSSSPGSATATPFTTPSAPTNLTATPAASGVNLSWTAPNTGGSAITGYTVTSAPPGGSCVVTGTTASCTGLTPQTTYTFTVVATNAAGNGPAATVQGIAAAPVSRTSTVTENYPAPTNYDDYVCSVSPSSAGSCSYTTSGTDRMTFDPRNNAAVGTVVTVTWTFQDRRNRTLVTVTRTYVVTA